MRRLQWLAMLAVCLAVASGPVAVLQAATVTGTAVQIGGLDNLNATVQEQARQGSGKTIATIVGLAGLAVVLAGRAGMGLLGLGAGVGMGFVPGIMDSAFTGTQAATLDAVTQVSPFAGQWYTPLLATLYPAFLALNTLRDPVFLAALALLVAWRYVGHPGVSAAHR